MPSSKKPDSGERVSGPPLEKVSSPSEAADRKAAEDARIDELLKPPPTQAEA